MAHSVLVVDDEADLLKTYERLLHRRGYQVVAVGTRREGLVVIRSRPLTLVVADVKLPDGDGLDIVRAARAIAAPPPVIVVTGFASDTNRQQAIEAGATAYLPKPFAVSAFTELVERLAALRPDEGLPGGLA